MAEHYADIKDKKDESHMLIHAQEEHHGEIEFSCRVLESHNSPLVRQVSKAINIRLSSLEGIKLLNNKNEYNR